MDAIAAGYFSIAVLNSFNRILTSIYFRSDLTLTGNTYLPSTAWVIGVTLLQFAFGLLRSLLAATIARDIPKNYPGINIVYGEHLARQLFDDGRQ